MGPDVPIPAKSNSWVVVLLHGVRFRKVLSQSSQRGKGQCISWSKESKHTHRSNLADMTNVVPPYTCKCMQPVMPVIIPSHVSMYFITIVLLLQGPHNQS